MDGDRPAAWVVVFGLVVLLVSGLFILALQSCSGFGDWSIAKPRKHLKPIPIDKRACPYVVAMHSTANAFQSAQPFLGFYEGPGDSLIDVPWPRVRARVRRSLLDLQLAILVGRPHFPPAVRTRLTATLAAVLTGLRQLARAHGTDELMTKTSNALS